MGEYMHEEQYKKLLDKLEELTQSIKTLKKDTYRSEELKDLFAALAKAQAEMGYASLNKKNAYFDTRYADIIEVVKSSRAALTKNGLAVIQEIKLTDDGQSILHTMLTHSSGQWIESRARILPPKNDIQTMHSYLSDLKKMCYSSLIGVAVDGEDDDGEIAMANARQIIAKGPSNAYNPKEQSLDTITKEQLEELEYELANYPDIAEEVLDKLRLQSLADMPKTKYHVSITRIREIKNVRNGVTKPKQEN